MVITCPFSCIFRFKKELNDIELQKAAALHPFFRLTWVRSDDDKEKLRKLIREEARELHQQFEAEKGAAGSPEQAAQQGDGPDGVELDVLDEDETSFWDMGQSLEPDPVVPSSLAYLDKCVNDFLDGPKLNLMEELKCKELRHLYIKYNTRMPSSAAAERLFSTVKRTIRPNRTSMGKTRMDKVVFMAANKTKFKDDPKPFTKDDDAGANKEGVAGCSKSK